jgi:hypothetical protein
MMSDISAPALEKAMGKVRQLVPGAKRVDTMVSTDARCNPRTGDCAPSACPRAIIITLFRDHLLGHGMLTIWETLDLRCLERSCRASRS